MVDELKSGAQLNSSRTAAAESATKIKDAVERLYTITRLALSCRAPYSKRVHICAHTHTHTWRVTFYGLSSSSSSLYDF